MRPSAYIETSVISYLTSRPSRELVTAAHQQLTVEWWAGARLTVDAVVSQLVVEEIRMGDAASAHRRIEAIDGLPILELTHRARDLARALLDAAAMPASAVADALHVAIAAEHGADYLVTWNCRHIASARLRPMIEATLRAHGYHPPVLCTPEELMDP